MPELMVLILISSFIMACYIGVLIWGYAEGVIGQDPAEPRSTRTPGHVGDGQTAHGADAVSVDDVTARDRSSGGATSPSAVPKVVASNHSEEFGTADRPIAYEVVQLDRLPAGGHLPDRLRWLKVGTYASLEYSILKVEARRQYYRDTQNFRRRWFFVREIGSGRVEWVVEGVGDELQVVIDALANRTLPPASTAPRVHIYRIDLPVNDEDRLTAVELGSGSSRFYVMLKLASLLQQLESEEELRCIFIIQDDEARNRQMLDPYDQLYQAEDWVSRFALKDLGLETRRIGAGSWYIARRNADSQTFARKAHDTAAG